MDQNRPHRTGSHPHLVIMATFDLMETLIFHLQHDSVAPIDKEVTGNVNKFVLHHMDH